ncbi:hypothetical protein HRbin23_01253 [bacterium HR23]|nr:hypothetical protein HRbin23_01253 [bacterium HR23]
MPQHNSRHLCTSGQAVALAVYRPSLGRWATVGKLVPLGGALVLAVPYRHRRRLRGRASLPSVAVRHARERGAVAILVHADGERLALGEGRR